MFWEPYDEQDGYKIWLSQSEVEQFIEAAQTDIQELAFLLGVRCGLRSDEIVRVCPEDARLTDAGWMLRVDGAKGGGLRQTPVPEMVAGMLRARHPDDEPIVDVTTRSIRNWVSNAGDRLAEDTGEEMWSKLSPHDLRRTWATSLDGADVNALIVCDWGGWSNLETFLDAYRGTNSPEVQKDNRERVDWL